MTDFFSEIIKITDEAIQTQHMQAIATIKVDLINSAKAGETSKIFFNTGLTLGQAKRAFPGFEIEPHSALQAAFKMSWLHKCSKDTFYNAIIDMAKEKQVALVPSFEKKWKDEIKKAAAEGKTAVTIDAPIFFAEAFNKLYEIFLPFRIDRRNEAVYLSWER